MTVSRLVRVVALAFAVAAVMPAAAKAAQPKPRVVVDLGTPGGVYPGFDFSEARAVSDGGAIAGSTFGPGFTATGFVLQTGRPVELFDLQQTVRVDARVNDINDGLAVVGSNGEPRHAFVRSGGTMTSLP